MKIWVIYKIRKDVDKYQSHTWRLISAGDNEQDVRREMKTLNEKMSPSESRVGWTYELTNVEANIHVAAN